MKCFVYAAFGAACLLLTQTVQARAIPRTYRLPYYPKGPLGCAGTAEDLADRFATYANVRVYRGVCEGEGPRGYQILISYSAEPPLRFTSTLPEEYGRSIYQTQKECNAALDEEAQHFSDVTTIAPFVSYCYTDGDSATSHPYFMRIEGVGGSFIQPYFARFNLYEDPIGDRVTLARQARSALEQLGVDVRRVALRRDGGFGFNSWAVAYYSPVTQPLALKGFTTYKDPDVCERELAESQPQLQAGDVGLLAMFCTYYGLLSEAKLYVLLHEGAAKLDSEWGDNLYPSMAACKADRAAMIKHFQDDFERPAFWALCDRGPDGFRMRVLSRYVL